MKGFDREDRLVSLCGLNCGLCPMKIGGYCPGCGGGPGNQSCAIAKCSLSHNGVAYCTQCVEFPCQKYQDIDCYDSFITHQNRRKDLKKLQTYGVEAYHAEQREKAAILTELLQQYNDGRRKTLFCTAVNLLELDGLKAVMTQLHDRVDEIPLEERAKRAAALLQAEAQRQSVDIRLRKKSKKTK